MSVAAVSLPDWRYLGAAVQLNISTMVAGLPTLLRYLPGFTPPSFSCYSAAASDFGDVWAPCRRHDSYGFPFPAEKQMDRCSELSRWLLTEEAHEPGPRRQKDKFIVALWSEDTCNGLIYHRTSHLGVIGITDRRSAIKRRPGKLGLEEKFEKSVCLNDCPLDDSKWSNRRGKRDDVLVASRAYLQTLPMAMGQHSVLKRRKEKETPASLPGREFMPAAGK
ncbi:hypothetical protein MCOR07_008800 [Pyricularia oryzae]|nr:hypothetical protein MCOR29_007565 [Pyricularia oryzae]KAI6408048.1 hypothetical protein MCOR23_001543 [Pyricularia oryzae]KAI6471421.1 hypothetical protein MCOR15_000949 [Pyricularia oryzae]KAI6511620.1 hypothetical protein MCOR10_010027 [Pyricularia oryzae]KAI6543878.1 hypothetical protein MCOR05_002864 [Pyricularia oryzae]